MEMIYYTIAAVALYFVSDFILNRIEIKMGKRLPSRSFYFLIIITILAMVSFSFVRAILGPLDTSQQTTNTQTGQLNNDPASAEQIKILPTNKQTKN